MENLAIQKLFCYSNCIPGTLNINIPRMLADVSGIHLLTLLITHMKKGYHVANSYGIKNCLPGRFSHLMIYKRARR